jgi:quercetin dioxygenase-like cupin family protein
VEEDGMAYYISRASERVWTDSKEVPGLRGALMVGEVHGAQHMEVSLSELAPGATIGWHRSPFEDSWSVEEGTGRVSLAGLEYDLGVGDYGVAPVGVAHSITAGDDGLRWFSVHTPKPPNFEGARHHIACQPLGGENLGRPSACSTPRPTTGWRCRPCPRPRRCIESAPSIVEPPGGGAALAFTLATCVLWAPLVEACRPSGVTVCRSGRGAPPMKHNDGQHGGARPIIEHDNYNRRH